MLHVIFSFCLTITYNAWVFWCVLKAEIYYIWACESNIIMVHKLLNIYTQSFKSQSLGNRYFYGFRGRQIQGPPRTVHTLATPLVPWIENRVPRIRENYVRVPRIRENRVPTGPYGVPNIFLKKPAFISKLFSECWGGAPYGGQWASFSYISDLAKSSSYANGLQLIFPE